MGRLCAVCICISAALVLAGCGSVVPDVEGMTLEEAADSLAASGLELGVVTYDDQSSQELWTIVSQTPNAGRRAGAGSEVSLVLAGPAPVEVPTVQGLLRQDALSALELVGLQVGDLDRAYDDSVPAGRVISQQPEAEAIVPSGQGVRLVVSQGPTPAAVPDVVGGARDEATITLEAAGFTVEVETQHDTAAEGVVVEQSPSAGSTLQPGRAVRLTVSDGPEMILLPDLGYLARWPEVRRRTLALGLNPAYSWGEEDLDMEMTGAASLANAQVRYQNPPPGSTVAQGTTVHFVITQFVY